MNFVVDASIAIKWVVEEAGTDEAWIVYRNASLIAPDLLAAECSNILWKKVSRNNLTDQEAILAARVLAVADLELVPTRPLMETATRLAIDLDHPAYDCVYIALAAERGCRFVTADQRLLNKLGQRSQPSVQAEVISLAEAARELAA